MIVTWIFKYLKSCNHWIPFWHGITSVYAGGRNTLFISDIFDH